MILAIVESPSKTRSIASYLGKGWIVEASYGHVRDLPTKGGINITLPGYIPNYVLSEKLEKQKQISKLIKLAAQADEIWMATDPDREGEAIAWHLQEILGKGKIVRRVAFNEITRAAVLRAIENPREIDMQLVDAQQARRVLDRIYGWKLSPALSEKIGQTVSAGRVQSVALRMIVDREKAIRDFESTEHYGVKAVFRHSDVQWSAEWQTQANTTENEIYITDRRIAELVAKTAQDGLIVQDYLEREEQRMPTPPLITSTMQQAAANYLEMSVSETMKAAQKLFEDGLITYMRTDNPNLSEEAIAELHKYLRSVGQSEHIAEQPHYWKAKENAQEAHEAIRPTDFSVREANSGNEKTDELYRLIRRVAIASQLKPAQYKVRRISMATVHPVNNNESTPALFVASGRKLTYKGWLIMAKDFTDEDASDADDGMPPVLKIGEQVIPENTEILEKKTRSPKRYTETSIIKDLERYGIGRPSTYASIIEILLKRGYTTIEKKKFQPTDLGERVIDALAEKFAILETNYTAEMENNLDKIASGKAQYVDILKYYDDALNHELDNFSAEGHIDHEISLACPACGVGRLRRIKTAQRTFWGCSEYQAGCKYTARDVNGQPAARDTRFACPECDTGYLQRRASAKHVGKYWWGCDNYPDCEHTARDKNGHPV